MNATPTGHEPLLEVRDLSVSFGGLRAVDGLSFSVRESEIFGIIGPNGAGKSTCFNALCGSIRPTSGRVLFARDDVTGLPAHAMARRGMARTFQLTSLFHQMSIGQNLVIAMHLHRRGGVLGALMQTRNQAREKEALAAEARAILSWLGMEHLYDLPASAATFVQQRWLEVAIGIALKPKLLLLDEPAAGLSPPETRELGDLVRDINGRGITVLLIEHNMKFVMSLCERLCVLNYGSKFAEGSPQGIAADPSVQDIYLGTDHADA